MPLVSKIKHRLASLLFKLAPWLAVSLRVEYPHKSDNRRFLENDIFRYLDSKWLANESTQCLFIGTDKRSWHYRSRFRAKFFTIDNDPRKARYGARHHHTVGSAIELESYYVPDQFNVIIANGLIGFGVNEINQCDDLFAGLAAVIKRTGLLVLSYDNRPSHINFRLEDVKNYQLFEKFVPNNDGLEHSEYVFGDHIFVFLRLRCGAP